MKRLEELSVGARFIIVMGTVLAILFAFAFVGWYFDRWDQAVGAPALKTAPMPAQPMDLYSGIPFDRHLLELDRKALNESYSVQIQLLFSVWLKAPDVDGAQRFQNGLRNARKAFGLAAAQIERREKEMEGR